MKTILGLALLASLAASCQTSPFNNHRYGYSTPTVDDKALVYVPESDRGGIAKARTEVNEMKDRVSIAERNVTQEKQRLGVAKDELKVADASVEASEKALDVAQNSDESVRSRDVSAAKQQLESAQARWRSAESKIAFLEAHIDQLKSDVELANMRVELGDARVELAKAKAVVKLDRPEARNISVSEFEASVEEKEAHVAMAEVDANAWEKKVKLRQEALDKHLQARAASYDKKSDTGSSH